MGKYSKGEIQDLFYSNIDSKEIYLDNSATTKRLKCVTQKQIDFYKNSITNTNNTSTKRTYEKELYIDNTRDKILDFLGLKEDDKNNIVFTKSATESLNLSIKGILDELIYNTDYKEINIVTTQLEHSSAIVPIIQYINKYNKIKKMMKEEYQKEIILKVIPVDENFQLDYSKLNEVITPNTNLIVMTAKSNVTGEIIKLDKVVGKIEKMDSKPIFVLDASQIVGQNKINFSKYDIDVICFSGHKMFANSGIGVMYINRSSNKQKINLNFISPLLYGGRITNGIVKEKDNIHPVIIDDIKYEAGSMNIESIISLNTAIDIINDIGIDNIEKSMKELTNYLYNKLSEISNTTIYTRIENSSSIVSFNIENIHPHDIATLLESNNIYIRTGKMCAHLLVDEKMRTGVNRISLSIYNTKEEIDILIAKLKEIIRIFNNG